MARVSLDEVLVPLLSETSAAEGAHKAGGHRLPKPERIADSDDEIPDFELIASPIGIALTAWASWRRRTARSVPGSRPTSFARKRRPSFVVTCAVETFATTWLAVST